LILAENLGAWLVGPFGNTEIRTPNLDLLARSGSRFRNHTAVAPACAANRATLLTGRLPRQHGIEETPGTKFGAEVAISDLLAAAGYECGYVGKWDLGDADTPQHGFRFWRPAAAGGQGYASEQITRQAVEFLDGRKPEQPFFLIVSHPGPIAPYEGHPRKYDELYAKLTFDSHAWLPAAANASEGKEFLKDYVGSMRKYAGAVSALDDQIPPVVSVLDKKGIRDQTLVIFTSASGLLAGRHGLWGAGRGSDPVNLYAEAVETPMIWNWPGKVPVEGARAELVGSYDLFPTLCEVAKVAPPTGRNLCGRSYLAPITNQPLPRKAPWQNVVFASYGVAEMVRDSRFKLVLRNRGAGPNELYDVRVDARELVNQYENSQFLTVRNALAESLRQWREKYV
jgi:arylsulfatase A-like enzyme